MFELVLRVSVTLFVGVGVEAIASASFKLPPPRRGCFSLNRYHWEFC
ncbi:MAG: hypothetical protein LBT96_01005 [Campylobacteraceae bacterium]|nr:hypothetical protein [Campylobacteraceae bacterium]